MKLGFVTSILQDYTFEQTIDFAAEQGFQCVEVACWPVGKAERRYAGVSHLDVANMTPEKAQQIKALCDGKNIAISALAFYPNTMDGDLEKRKEAIDHLYKVIHAAAMLGVNTVTTFIGRDQFKSVEENLELFQEIWPPIIREAEKYNVRIAIENCPMLFDRSQWPGGQNLFTTPVLWEKMFGIIDSPCFGINYDPSHFVWQMIDYIQPIYEFRSKIFHVHVKDIKLYRDKLLQCGTMAYPLDFMSPKLPGLGDVDWGKYISALTDIGYQGCVALEIEDRAYEGSQEDILNSLILSKRYMSNYII